MPFYGAYPAGFLHRARALLGVSLEDAVLHVCAGRVRDYPYKGLGPNDQTMDVDPRTHPDFCLDITTGFPTGIWQAILIDPPYTVDDAKRYGDHPLPAPNGLLKAALLHVPVGHRVGMLHYIWPQPPKWAHEIAVVAVGTGRNNRARWFTVFERDEE